MIDDTRIRFLSSIAAQLDVDRIAEVHLFPAIRQGGMESGVAVLALDQARPLEVPAEEIAAEEIVAEEIVAEVPSEVVVESASEVIAEVMGEECAAETSSEEITAQAESASDESPYAESDVAEVAAELDVDDFADIADDSVAADDLIELAESEPDEAPARPKPRRFTVYTARYRHTLKGPDRGKWEVSVTEEADAPLMTIDAVVRGVQRRSGDVDEIVRLTGDEIAALTAAPTTAARL